MGFERLSNLVIGLAIEVHKRLGPGLLERVYKRCLAYELAQAGIGFVMEFSLPVNYKGLTIKDGYRIDLLVDNRLVVEVKSVAQIHPVHESQILTYMRLAKIKTGLLINFNVCLLKEGIKRYIL